jgi:hypothetical protein
VGPRRQWKIDEFWNCECEEYPKVRAIEDSGKRISEVEIRLSGNTG